MDMYANGQPKDWIPQHNKARKVKGSVYCCELCGSGKNVDVHHKDHDYRNNELHNLQALCRRCHMLQHKPDRRCSVDGCGRPHASLGFCDMHYQRLKRHGDPLFVFTYLKKGCTVPLCERVAKTKGLCHKHYEYSRMASHPPTRSALNAAKTHCLKGHPFDEKNTKWNRNGNGVLGRGCKTCANERARIAYHRSRLRTVQQ